VFWRDAYLSYVLLYIMYLRPGLQDAELYSTLDVLDALLRVATDLGVGYEIIRWMSSRRLNLRQRTSLSRRKKNREQF